MLAGIAVVVLSASQGQRLMAADPLVFSDDQYRRILAAYGDKAKERVSAWERVLEASSDLDVDQQLYKINRFFNKVPFVDDIDHWQKSDYWATPVEFLATNGGDCEDFTIAKYFSLRALGVPGEKMRFMYVKALRLNQAHMVLAYYPTPTSVPLVLDNINTRILPASERQDLLPVYSFNGDGLWLAKAQGRGKQLGDSPRQHMWNDLLSRMDKGF